MPRKRRNSFSGPGPSPYTKRSRPSYVEGDEDDDDAPNSVTPYERPRNHPVFGQKSAFPGLDTADDDELFYGPADDGMEYLRMVRSEANSLPTLFTVPGATDLRAEKANVTGDIEQAQDQTQPEEEIEDESTPTERVPNGIFNDGVYIGLPATDQATTEGFSDAQSSYYNLLHHRFLLLRSILKCTPPSEAISALDDSHPISFPRRSKNAQKEWRRLLLTVDPQTVQLACMDMDTVLGVLVIVARLMSENVRSGDVVLVRRIGAWAWGLLGKCREAGQLGAQEIGDIRELGKRAVKILQKMREKEVHEEGEEDGCESDAENANVEDTRADEKSNENQEDAPTAVSGPDEPGAENGADIADAEELERAKARLEAQVAATAEEPTAQEAVEEEKKDEDEGNVQSEGVDVDVETQTRAMLDMIITVVGEHYGQRDLLEAREIWNDARQRFLSHELPSFKTSPAMAPALEISIPTTTTSTTSPPYTIYNITLRLPLRSFAVSKRYSDFTDFHTALISQTNAPPPLPLPPKSWFSNTVSNANLRESRRQALESYLRAINDADDARWRTSPAWRAFLNLPSLGSSNSNNENGAGVATARLHAAVTGPGAGGEPITDPTLWLDCYRDMKSHLHDARLQLTRRDQETTPHRQHECSARAKSSLVRAGTLISALEDGLKRLSETSNGSKSSAPLGEGELRRRKDLVINARKEKDGLEDLQNAMATKSRIDNAVASIKDKEALMGSPSGGRKGGATRSGRVLGKETERTRGLDNQGVLQLQRDTMQEQDLSVQELMKIVTRQKELGVRINEELQVQNEMLRLVNEDADRLEQKVAVGRKRLGKIS
ncbi:hypothetical protein BJX61DRAFT_534426 [Aspergillus egyptiacus]|nr:hypothetical protein BJX61DRAFT_534426 [Aspergillus egyptiacus]